MDDVRNTALERQNKSSPTQRPLSKKACEDLKTVEYMIRLYCRAKHRMREGLCEECEELLDYVRQRRARCPFGDKKTFCSNCKIQCYKPSMKEKIVRVMKYSGPRLMFYNPKLVFEHIGETIKLRRQRKKEEKRKYKEERRNGKVQK